jgi:hypothetical protein
VSLLFPQRTTTTTPTTTSTIRRTFFYERSLFPSYSTRTTTKKSSSSCPFSSSVIHNNHQRRRPVAMFLNCSRLDYDQQLDFSRLETLTEFHRHNTDYVTNVDEMIQLVNNCRAEIVITKEMTVPPEAVYGFSSTGHVRLLCEAGTGYNNIPLSACRERNILVCNVPTYSTEAVAHTAITYIMNFSINLLEQQRMLHSNDRSNFTVRKV